ncbi:MAG TPA: glycosyltransferase family 2 protein [Chloroflexota bacterium]|jgi:cellulose synthase/poly-beta-1,6-N-acetylglucosamine synthase-like glycosyltransferase|nr:glycosyltransferase family 2 protein [Chloroflexota bacterium]
MTTHPQPAVSVIICAYTERRWRLLIAALAALRLQTRPPLEVIVVVDHNPLLLARLRAFVPDVLILENTDDIGASGARNTAIVTARGDVLAFLDDDAVPQADWLEHLTEPFSDPCVAGVGGASVPHWEGGCPSWFPPEFNWVVGCSYPGMPERRAPIRNLWGVNMALRRTVLLQSGLFNTALGPVGTRPVNCEETELCIRIRQIDPHWMFFFEPCAVVKHEVPRARACWRYYLLRCFEEGRSKALVTALVGASDGLRTERAYVTRLLPQSMLDYLGQALSGRDVRGGCGRAAALMAGLIAAANGYLSGRIAQRGKASAGRGEASA